MEKYKLFIEKHASEYHKINRQFNFVSMARLLVGVSFIATLYFYLNGTEPVLMLFLFLFVVLFLVLIRLHHALHFNREISRTLIGINQDELNCFTGETRPFPDGNEYMDTVHPYSYDLDVFGSQSLFHILNRTATVSGKNKLAESLLAAISPQEILRRQGAVKELSNEIEWRHKVFAIAKLAKDSKEVYHNLVRWSCEEPPRLTRVLVMFSFLSPITLLIAAAAYFLNAGGGFGVAALVLFAGNLMVLVSKLKVIKKEMLGASKIDDIIKKYSLIIKEIEKKFFRSEKLNDLKGCLHTETGLASNQLGQLADIYSELENIQNPLGAMLFNGFFLYHIHKLRELIIWKKRNGVSIVSWLNSIGEFEALGSLANFSFNNPAFTFPLLNDVHRIVFRNLGHPLIPERKRVLNDVEFDRHGFIILTGSNMSGKSTFLRSLGVSMILTGAGGPICASYATVHPLPVCVSMRLSDSLKDSESYFFAEVKRLKQIMDRAGEHVSFVLLDEILRGTNSDDKRTGTMEVIKKLVAKRAIGVIATHDLKVCSIADSYPEQLVNKCFEVEIANNELVFDYKLKDGICRNKSATFLMKKMQVI
jgi:Ca2+/Na+ antiporter